MPKIPLISLRLVLRSSPAGQIAAPALTPNRVGELAVGDLTSAMRLPITQDAYNVIARTVGSQPAETGAVLGGSRTSTLITRAQPDGGATVTRTTYSPDVDEINRLLREDWSRDHVAFRGFVHSHPARYESPSAGDRRYAGRILDAIPSLNYLALPIVQSQSDTGHFELNGFVAVRDARSEFGVRLVPAPVTILNPDAIHKSPTPHPYLERVRDSYDPAVMASTRIVAVGVGGSAGYLETMARCGIGEFVLIDPDVIEPKNVGTQAVDPIDIGRPKVAALADRLARLNPHCQVWTVQAKESELDDFAFSQLIRGVLPGAATVPALTLVGAFTDSFWAQDRCHRLGLHFGVPTMAAGVHAEGRGIELAYAAPGLTRACIRCTLWTRYRAYLEEGFVNDVTSEGSPMLATDRLNASKQVLTLALLHALSPLADVEHPATRRWRRTMEALADRNLAISRLDPDNPVRVFTTLTEASEGRSVIDDTAWLKPTPDDASAPGGACPDCGGTGDLSDSTGTYVDTRFTPTTYGLGRRGTPSKAVAA